MKFKKISTLAAHARHCFGRCFYVGLLTRILLCAALCGSAAAQFTGCPLNSSSGQIHHIVYIQFDNLHFERDNPNVPSDLEQMPHLLNFLTNNGTLFANHHTPLISHTADDILTSLTGVYPDRHGQAVSNSFVIYNLPTNKYWDSFPSSFTYWTDLVSTSLTSDTAYSMVTPDAMNAPAPWVPFTRASCNVGAVSIANMEFENVAGDIVNVYGNPSPEYTEAQTNYYQAVADFEGIAVHCAQNNSVCAGAHGRPDLLPDEPGGGYANFNGLFGHKYVVPAINNNQPLYDLNGVLITDTSTPPNIGFPGFGGISPAQTLAYVATMLEHDVPIVFSYISDAHDKHTYPYRAFGPGEAGYVAQLKAYDAAFGLFFQRLANDGIDQNNTLFIISADEQDHFVGGPAAPSNCDGVNTPCTYTYSNGSSSIGEIEVDLQGLMNQQFPSLVPSLSGASNIFDFHYDMAPAVSLYNFGPPNTVNTSNPVDPTLPRQFERAFAQLTAVNPITGNTDQLTRFQVDAVGLKALHMITADPQRTPTFVMFGDPDYYFEGSNCGSAARASCIVIQNSGYAWNHGGVAPEINTTWVGMVGPGVKKSGIDYDTWSDHTDIRPTMLLLSGLQDDYSSDGRVLLEGLAPHAIPPTLRSSQFRPLAAVYKQINAPVGSFGRGALQVSTVALASNAPNDATYQSLESGLSTLTAERDALAAQIRAALEAAEFQGQPLDHLAAAKLLVQAQQLLSKMARLAQTGE